MTVAEITTELQGRAAEMPTMDLSIKLNLKGDGIIHVDSKGATNVVTNEDLPADCTITITPENFQKLDRNSKVVEENFTLRCCGKYTTYVLL